VSCCSSLQVDYEDDQYRAAIALCGHAADAHRFRSQLCVREPDKPHLNSNSSASLGGAGAGSGGAGEGSGSGGGAGAGAAAVVPPGGAPPVSSYPPSELSLTARPLTIFELQEDRKLETKVHLRFPQTTGDAFARKAGGGETSKIDFWGRLFRTS
jgi:hypothetical protein